MIFSRPYLSNGRAIGMVVIRPFFRLSVCNRYTLANGLVLGENFLHE